VTNYYSVLAPIYERIGLGDFAIDITPRIIQFAQQNDWTGRSIADLGAGTGASTRWLANRGYVTTAIDHSEEMLTTAQRMLATDGLSVSYEQRDIRELEGYPGSFDMALALDVMNEFSSLREIEQVFRAVAGVLEPRKWFVFDVCTIQGLSEAGRDLERIIFEDPNLLVLTRTAYDHDRQISEIEYVAFHRDGDYWRRFDCARTLRGYPIQALATLLQRTGFTVKTMVTSALTAYEPGVTRSDRMLIFAIKN